jgi:hypothetical protein
MRIDSSGNVGIGTASPNNLLDVRGSSSPQITLNNTSAVSNDTTDATIATYGGSTSYWSRLNYNASQHIWKIYSSEKMRIDSSGNVGIGTTSPTVASGYTTLTLNSSSNGGIYYVGKAGTNIGSLYSASTNAYSLEAIGASTFLQFNTNGAESMRITPDGTVRMNCANYTTGPSSTSNGIALEKNGGQPFWNHAVTGTGLTSYYVFINSNGVVGTIRTTGSSTQYNTSSDYRLKEDIKPMVGALDKVVRLNPVTYKWKVDGTDGQGFIAHELAEVVPECVSGEKDAVNEDGSINPQGIDTSNLVATLTAAIQELAKASSEQQALITSLTARITALEGATSQAPVANTGGTV